MKNNSLLKSFSYAFKGLEVAFKERNFKLHIVSTVSIILFGFIFGINKVEWLVILLCIGMVLSLELVNTAVEHVVDMVSPEINEKAGRVKDIAAAAVLVASIVAFLIGLVIFLPYLY